MIRDNKYIFVGKTDNLYDIKLICYHIYGNIMATENQ